MQQIDHLTIAGVHGQPVASYHAFIALLKHIIAFVINKGTLLTIACILPQGELTHAQDWKATFRMFNIIFSYICTHIHASVTGFTKQHRVKLLKNDGLVSLKVKYKTYLC